MSEMEPWTRQLLSVIVSQLCKTIGWHSISTTCLQVLVDVLHRYLKQLGTNICDYSDHYNHTVPALEEIHLAFIDMGINVDDLKEYVSYVTPITIKQKVPKYPLEKKSNLNFLKPGSREVVTRPVHIHEYLPAMYPEMSDENYSSQENLNHETSSLPSLTDTGSAATGFQKSTHDGREAPKNKHVTRLISKEVGRPLRELGCVMMTSSGFLSPAREGRGPKARLPKLPNISSALLNNNSAAFPSVPHDVKGEHKKSHSKANCGAKSSERKIREEHSNGKIEIHDSNPKTKKLVGVVREVSKLKALKPVSISNKTANVDSLDAIKTPPKSDKLKANVVHPLSPKEPKIAKLTKVTEKPLLPEPEIMEEKLTTEPNKQKLNIFKRISKVKEDRADSSQPQNVVPDKSTQIKDCIEAVVKRGHDRLEPNPAAVRERELEITLVSQPVPASLPEPLTVDTSSYEKTLEAIPSPAKHAKRKKKQKSHDTESNKRQKLVQAAVFHAQPEKPKPTEPEPPLYSLLTHLQSGKMPPSLSSNLLIPRFINPFMNITKLDPNCPHPEMPNLPMPPAALMQANVENHVSVPMKVESEKKMADNGAAPLGDKKLKKKMKKDKREKDKKKRDKKQKLKNKEKLQKKKDLKKQLKLKNKTKNKKQKAKTTPLEEPSLVTEDPSVPKLKLKITGSASPQLSPSDVKSPKIVIKPIVKQDETPYEESAPPREVGGSSPELAKIAFINKPAKQKTSIKATPAPEVVLTHKSVVEPATMTVSTKNSKKNSSLEVKMKNKEKNKSKKVEEAKPAAFYYDADGNQVWICPACGAQDDGSPMVGCDGCDAWYHWVCVGIKSAPDSAKWFCGSCAKKKT